MTFNFRVDAKDQEERKAEARGWRGEDKKTKRGQAIRITRGSEGAERGSKSRPSVAPSKTEGARDVGKAAGRLLGFAPVESRLR